MNLEQYVDFCMSLGDVTQDFPFDNKTMVFRFHGKIFALMNVERWHKGEAAVNLKNTPEKNTYLRDQYASIVPGYHMNKKHWNTLRIFEEELDQDMIYELTLDSYNLIKKKLRLK